VPLHGLGCNLAFWKLMEPLLPYRVAVNIDGLGFGHQRTPPAMWTPAEPEGWEDVGDLEWMEAEVLAEQQELVAVGVAARDLPDEIIRRGFLTFADDQWRRAPTAA